jgi:hypothetical protein
MQPQTTRSSSQINPRCPVVPFLLTIAVASRILVATESFDSCCQFSHRLVLCSVAGGDLMSLLGKAFVTVMTLVLSLSSVAQDKPKYQVGTIMEVKDHQPATADDSKKQYDIVVKVRDTLYTVIFTSASGSRVAEYSAGMDRPVLIDGDTLKFSDLHGNSVSAPILSRKQVSKKPSSSAGNDLF